MTEKYAQALVAGSVPVVIGATNMEDFAIAPNSMLVLESTEVWPILMIDSFMHHM